MVSKFNPLFNGEQALLKAEATMELQHKDNFDEILPVYKLGDEQLISSLKPDLDKAIEKGSKVIQGHSMLIKNSQKNKYIDNCYVLIGTARFYQRDYLRALETFNYVLLEYPKEEAVYEAKMWAAKCKTALGNTLAAKEDFEKIYREKKVDKKLKADIFASYAQLEINEKRYKPSYQLLQQAISHSKSKKQRIRWLFICGQLQAKLGNDFEAREIFGKVIKKGPPYALLFQAQLNRARNFDVELNDISKAYDELEDMLKDDKNFDNRDQIYYAMAEIAEKLEEEGLMEDYLKKSVKAFTTNNKQKALSFLKLAELNFTNREYITAEAYFDSTFKSMDASDPRYALIQQRKISLGKLVENLDVIDFQDSLQYLAGLDESERTLKIQRQIEKLKEEDAAKKEAEFRGNDFSNLNGETNKGGNFGNPAAPGGGAQWYFYNTNIRSIGLRDFTNKFGERKLEDNWRRKNKETLANVEVEEENDPDSSTVEETNTDKYAIENFIKDIPLSPEAMEASNEKIIQAYQNCGRIYKDNLEDLDAAIESLEDLLGRFNNFAQQTRVWYTLYRIYLTLENEGEKEKYKKLILDNDPESEYAYLILNEGKEIKDPKGEEAKNDYSLAYDEYSLGNYSKSLGMAGSGIQKHSESKFLPKFHLLKSFNLAKLNKKDEFINNLKLIIDLYPDTEESAEAESILSHFVFSEDPGDVEEEEGTGTPYQFNKNMQHKYVVVVPNKGSAVNQLRIKLTDFNKKFFPALNLNTKSLLMGSESQLIVISNFKNSDEALGFYRSLVSQKVLEQELDKSSFQHFVISSDNFPMFYTAKKVGEYLKYFETNYLK